MPVPRTSIIAGPARVSFQGQTLLSQDNVLVATAVRAFAVRPSAGFAQRREERVLVELTFTPEGAWLPVCALLGPIAGLRVGQDVFAGADCPLVIDSTDGQTYTFATAALTRPPEIVFSAGRTLFGPATFTALGANAAAPTAAGSRLRITASTTRAGEDSRYDPAAVVAQPYTLSWGSVDPWANLETDAGVTLAVRLTLRPRRIDSAGVLGLRVADVAATVRARPLDVPDSAVLAALKIQGAGAGRGRVLGAGMPDLVVNGAGVSARLYSAGLDAGTSEFGGAAGRVGTLTWTAGGGRQPAFAFGASLF